MSFVTVIERCINTIMAVIPRGRPSPEILKQARVIAHRGAHDRQVIENTDAAFARALSCHCWGIELDVRSTADGVLVVHHDPTLMRLWQRPEAIGELSFQDLRERVPDIPSLAEVINHYGKRLHLFIELKTPVDETLLYEDLQALTPIDDYHLISLDEALLRPFTRFPRAALLLVPEHNNVQQFCTLSLKANYGGVLGHYLLLSNKKIKPLTAARQQVGVGFIDSKNSLYRELNRGIRWVFTNRAQLVSALLSNEIARKD
ncbi:glycerophosphodiester phosphodiesterase [Legionella sp. MW5194]|uniref:glycerophosphodiester phosphodiesterase n=1 Tax=Legionella sp. MW5194 TaxID=2662448 RepID=UPI00193D4EA2|nr:glycerophosphodiester phosphodiesterase [Legionella sp. MW5194]QRN04963.1 glycerophosphodiester phosphodiesterase [Legionella sp. MW5194]